MAVVFDLLNDDSRKKGEAQPRHPEKAHRPDNPVLRKPDWIRVKAPGSPKWAETNRIVKENGLVTVCEEAGCPNVGECWEINNNLKYETWNIDDSDKIHLIVDILPNEYYWMLDENFQPKR